MATKPIEKTPLQYPRRRSKPTYKKTLRPIMGYICMMNNIEKSKPMKNLRPPTMVPMNPMHKQTP